MMHWLSAILLAGAGLHRIIPAGQAILPAMNIRIRPTTFSDAATLPAIERAAGERFREIPLARLAGGEVISTEEHLNYAERG